MRDHLRFSVTYWHTFRGTGADPFGPGTMLRPWDDGSSSLENARNRVRAAFEFIEKLGAPYYAFHDRDVAPEGRSLAETNRNLDAVVEVLKEEQARTGIKLLWGTASLFTHPRFVHGAATSPNADVFAYAAAQVKKAMEVTHALGGQGYTFWGGREGYSTLWNTDMKRELDHLAKFLHLAVDYKKGHRLHGPVLHRAEAQGADAPSVRQRRGGVPELSCASTTCCPTSSSTWRATTPRSRATRCSTSARWQWRQTRWAAWTPTPGTTSSAGTPTSSPPTST